MTTRTTKTNRQPKTPNPASRRRIPKYRHHKASGQGFVEFGGRRIYLGRFGLPESEQAYHQLIAEWVSNGYRLPPAPDEITIMELCAAFMQHARQHYRRADGTRTSSYGNYRQCMGPLTDLYGRTRVADFGPRALKAVRQQMIERGWARTQVNKHVRLVRSIFRWGVEQEWVPADVHHALAAVRGLQRGRTVARETDPVLPVPDHAIEAVKACVAPPVAAMIELQRLTGMRPGEVVTMRPRNLDTSGPIWTYEPESHKTEYHGHARTVFLGPQAQRVISGFLTRDLSAYMFSPAEAEEARRADRHRHRTTRLSCGNTPGSNRVDRPRRSPGDQYTTTSYRRAVNYGCAKAFPHPTISKIRTCKRTDAQKAELAAWNKQHRWHPNQLRHNAATLLRGEFGIDIAQTVLGHRLGSSVTEVYAEANTARAIEAVSAVG